MKARLATKPAMKSILKRILGSDKKAGFIKKAEDPNNESVFREALSHPQKTL